jgi:ABC-type multidrug transport system fused ATPase/permease subunit
LTGLFGLNFYETSNPVGAGFCRSDIFGMRPSRPPGVKIGLNVELTGEMPAVGASSRNAANLFIDEINAQGGLKVGDKLYPIELSTGDNTAKVDQAAAVAQRLISQDNVLAVLGPNASACAIPASAGMPAQIQNNPRVIDAYLGEGRGHSWMDPAGSQGANKGPSSVRTPILQITNLTVCYGDFRAVKGISFSVSEGEILALIGSNGAGKSCTLRAISRLR